MSEGAGVVDAGDGSQQTLQFLVIGKCVRAIRACLCACVFSWLSVFPLHYMFVYVCVHYQDTSPLIGYKKFSGSFQELMCPPFLFRHLFIYFLVYLLISQNYLLFFFPFSGILKVEGLPGFDKLIPISSSGLYCFVSVGKYIRYCMYVIERT